MREDISQQEWHFAYGDIFTAVNKRAPRPESGEVLDKRTIFYLCVLEDAGVLKKGNTLVDLGSGMSWLGPIARQLGLNVTLVDDFGGGGALDLQVYRSQSFDFVDTYRDKFGIRVVEQELIANPLPLLDESVDVVVCSHVLEHWHHSPKKLFGEIRRVLRPGGYFFVATPNAVNFRKRISVLLGRTNLCDLSGWYDHEIFRGHVREPVVADLHQLAEWNDLKVVNTWGRNFIGAYTHKLPWLPAPFVRRVVQMSNRVFQFFPTLCSDIHVLAQK